MVDVVIMDMRILQLSVVSLFYSILPFPFFNCLYLTMSDCTTNWTLIPHDNNIAPLIELTSTVVVTSPLMPREGEVYFRPAWLGTMSWQ